jgi:hypothetical protein
MLVKFVPTRNLQMIFSLLSMDITQQKIAEKGSPLSPLSPLRRKTNGSRERTIKSNILCHQVEKVS